MSGDNIGVMEDFGRREGLMQMQMIVGRSFDDAMIDVVGWFCGSLKADRLLAGQLKDTYERYGALERYENLLDPKDTKTS